MAATTIHNNEEGFTIRDYILWIVLIALGGGLAGFLEGAFFQFAGTLIFMGFLVGLGGWLATRRSLGVPAWWVLVTGIVWSVSWFVLPGFVSSFAGTLFSRLGLWEVFWLNLVQGFLSLLLIGIVQWIFLRNRILYAWAWIPASAFFGAVYGAVGATVCFTACDSIQSGALTALPVAIARGMPQLVVQLAAWAVYALATGAVLYTLGDEDQTPINAR